jgi:hypothetical protein
MTLNPKRSDPLAGQTSKRGQDEDPMRRQHEANVIEHSRGLGNSCKSISKTRGFIAGRR